MKSRPWMVGAAVVALLVSVLAGGWSYRWIGGLQERVRTAGAAQAAAHGETTAALAHATRLEVEGRRLAAHIRAAEARETAARLATDSVRSRAAQVRDSALAVARDSASTAAELRAAIERQAAASLGTEQSFLLERAASLARVAALLADTLSKAGQLVAERHSVAKLQTELAAANRVIRAMQRMRPAFLHRALNGVLTAGAGVGCAGVALAFTGPVGAVASGAGCAALAGIALP